MADDVELMRVNWSTGMLLTTEHFARQDAASEAASKWGWRHLRTASGLVGPGARNREAHGSPAFDPQLSIADDGQVVRLSLRQLRGLTPAGDIVEIGDASTVRGEFAKSALGTADSYYVYLVRTGHWEPDAGSVGADEANPTVPARCRPGHELRLDLPADLARDVVVAGRIRRAARTARFEIDTAFIPSCALLLAHSRLFAAWQRGAGALALLAGDFAELHRLVSRFIDQLMRRGLDVRIDLDVLSFVERAVLATDACAGDVTDPTEAPERFFASVERALHRTALALDLSPATRAYFQTLAGADAHYAALLEAQRDALARGALPGTLDDVGEFLLRAEETIERLQRLRDALAAKYVDYRVNRGIEGLRFLLDEGGEKFFGAVATPGHPQRDGDVVTFVFSDLDLSAQQEYRVVLVGDNGASWRVGEELSVTVRLNASMGGGRPVTRNVACTATGQRNFGLDFDPPPELGSIKTLDVSVTPGTRVRGALLFQRRRGVVAEAGILGSGAGVSARPVNTSGSQQAVPGEPRTDPQERKARPTPGAMPAIKINIKKNDP